MFIEIYNLSNQRLTVIRDYYDIHIELEANSWPTLLFSLPGNSPHWPFIVEENRVKYDNEWYVIKNIGAERMEDNVIYKDISCPSIASDLNHKYNQVLDITALPEVVLEIILEDTGWSIGTVDIPGGKSRTFQSDWNTVVANLRDVSEKFNGYLIYHSNSKTVDLIEEPGMDLGISINIGKNIRGIKKDSESTELVTRLYCYGSDDLVFTNENLGTPISEDLRGELKGLGYSDEDIDIQIVGKNQSFIQNFGHFISLGYTELQIYSDILERGEASVFIKVDKVLEGDYVDPLALLEDCKRKLDEELYKPKASYEISLLDLSQMSGYGPEKFELLDWVDVTDQELGIDIKTRISKMTIYPGFPEKTVVKISNMKESLSDILSTTVSIAEILGSSPRVSNLVRGLINTFGTTINSANGKLSWSDGILEAIDLDDANRRVRLTAGGIGVSKDGGQSYDNAMTADGVLANKVIVTDSIHLFSGDKKTKMTGTGVEVYDNSPTPVKIIHLGHYSPGYHGLWINSGHLEIVGSLPDSNIPDISANKIVGGTLGATSDIWVGKDKNIKIDGLNNNITVYDTAATPNARVTLGKIGGKYGLLVEDPDGNTLLSSYDKKLHIADGGTFIIGSSANKYQMKFDGTDLLFGSDVKISWGHITNVPDLYTDDDALAAWTASGYATSISETGVYTGTLTANQINAIEGIKLSTGAIIEWAKLETPPTASDVGARPDNWMPTASQVGARPSNWVPNAADVGAISNTYITEEGIWAGQIETASIIAGNLIGFTIQTNADDNERIKLANKTYETYNDSNQRNGVYMDASGGSSSFRIHDKGVHKFSLFYGAEQVDDYPKMRITSTGCPLKIRAGEENSLKDMSITADKIFLEGEVRFDNATIKNLEVRLS